MLNKRKLFIGCSREVIDSKIAQAVKDLITKDPELSHFKVEIWNETVWDNLETAVKTLVKSIEQFDYAIFIGYPDDEITSRREKSFTTRDNTTFEFGLFLSRLGFERTFFFRPEYSQLAKEFKILSDIGSNTFLHLYSLNFNNNTFEFGGFSNPDQFLNQIKTAEKKFYPVNNQTDRLSKEVEKVRAEIEYLDVTDEMEAISKFKESLNCIFFSKKNETMLPIKDIVIDTLDAIKDIRDFCKPNQLANIQKCDNGIQEVWVFADSPLEFEPKDEKNPDLDLVKETVKYNLSHGVKYVYFVSGSDFKEESIHQNLTNDVSLLKNMQIEFIEPRLFKTFFTLHFKEKNGFPDSIYMSSLLKHRKDLLIQISDSKHKERIYERILKLKGQVDTSKGYKKVNYTVQR